MSSIATYTPGMPTPITVVVIDDHVLFRTGLRELLEQEGIRVVGEASAAEEGIAAIVRHAPDVAIVDLGLPRVPGHRAIKAIVAEAPRTKVLVMTISTSESDLTDAVLAGACGYLLKDASASEIVAGVRAAASGESMVSPRMASVLLERVRSSAHGKPSSTAPQLSPRETDVLRMVVDGKDNATIARELFISPSTVKNHVSRILAKLEADNRLEAAVRAVREALV
jgi:DNA-binding NarL/FixJ family response regulator